MRQVQHLRLTCSLTRQIGAMVADPLLARQIFHKRRRFKRDLRLGTETKSV